MQHWTKLNISGAKPTAREYHAACCIAGPLTGQEHPLVLVIGGCARTRILRDAWLLDVDNEVWSQVSVVSECLVRIRAEGTCGGGACGGSRSQNETTW